MPSFSHDASTCGDLNTRSTAVTYRGCRHAMGGHDALGFVMSAEALRYRACRRPITSQVRVDLISFTVFDIGVVVVVHLRSPGVAP